MSDRYGVIGNPIAHSKSPMIHAEFARQTGQDIIYMAILAPLDRFAEAVTEFRAGGGRGLNVTVPFKQEAFKLATRLTERAALAQAVNTLKFEGGTILGDNTDGAGLVRDIRDNLHFSIEGKRVLLMGAGGAARGVLMPLLAQRPTSLTIANRTPEKAVALQEAFSAYGNVVASSYPDLQGRQFELVINATASSLHDEMPPLPEGVFAPGALAYDMMYGKDLPPFLCFAEQQGAAYLADGLGMLVEQAAESFCLWRGVRPSTPETIFLLRG